MARVAPAVPEGFEGGEEPRTRRVHPRQFVNEHHLPRTVVLAFKQLLEHEEGFHPAFGTVAAFHAVTNQGKVEVLQLVFQGHFPLAVVRRKACVMEGHIVAQHFVDEEGLAHATAAINRDKLGLSAIVVAVKFRDFLFSSDDGTHGFLRFGFAAKVLKTFRTATKKSKIRA